jgi:arginine decarboxylase
MRITVTSGTGTGPTPLAAFDAALLSAGVENYNLLVLSSMIPPGATIERHRFCAPYEEHGHRLYVVMARQGTEEIGEEVWAALGWVQEPGDGRGIFVEDHGHDEGKVRQNIELSLTSMMESRGQVYGPIDCELAGARCEGDPVCAIVVAVYKSMSWD